MHDVGENVGVERRNFGRFEDHGAAGCKRRCHFRGDLVQRVIPRRDAGDHTHGFASDARVADFLFESKFRREAGVKPETCLRQVRLDARSQLERHADLSGNRACDLVRARHQLFVDLLQPRRTLGGRRRRPGRERLTRCGHRTFDVRHGTGRDATDDVLGRGRDHVYRLIRRRRRPLTIDVEFVRVLHDREFQTRLVPGAMLTPCRAASDGRRQGRRPRTQLYEV